MYSEEQNTIQSHFHFDLQLMKVGCGPISERERRWVWQKSDLLDGNMNEHVDRNNTTFLVVLCLIIAELLFPLQDDVNKTSYKT